MDIIFVSRTNKCYRMDRCLMFKYRLGMHSCVRTCKSRLASQEFTDLGPRQAIAITVGITWLHHIVIMTVVGRCAVSFTKPQRTILRTTSSILYMLDGGSTFVHAPIPFGRLMHSYKFYASDIVVQVIRLLRAPWDRFAQSFNTDR